MVRVLGIASLLLISHIALVVAAAGVPHLRDTDTHDVVARAGCLSFRSSESYDIQLSKFSCSPCAQRSAMILIRAAHLETFVAFAHSVDSVRAWIQ